MRFLRQGGESGALRVVPLLFALAGVGVVPATAQDRAVAQDKAVAEPAAEPAWETAIRARRQQLVEQNGLGTDVALRTELLAMRDHDQEARGFRNGAPVDKSRLTMASNLAEIDAALTAQLKTIVAAKGWPTVALVGMEAANGAMLVLTHTADHAWQESLLPQLEALVDEGKIDGSGLALVIDKDLVAQGRPQRYGSQFTVVAGEMRMYAVEDPGGLDALRAHTLLPPMEVYRQTLSEVYHLKVSKRVVQPAAGK